MNSDKIDRKNSIGVAFSGGGLQGIAHIGAVQALYELGIHPQYVSGTSSGAAMAAIVAMGCDSDEMKRVAKKHWKTLAEIDNGLIFKSLAQLILNKKIQKDGIKSGELIEEVIRDIMNEKGITGFENLPINLSICTVDTLTTDECIFTTKGVFYFPNFYSKNWPPKNSFLKTPPPPKNWAGSPNYLSKKL